VTGAAALAALLGLAEELTPEIVEVLKALIEHLKEQHPSLVAAPPADAEGAIDAEADAAIKARFVGDPPEDA